MLDQRQQRLDPSHNPSLTSNFAIDTAYDDSIPTLIWLDALKPYNLID
jgi:hypothetical protein